MVNPLVLRIRAKKLGVLIRDARLAAGKKMKECAEAIGVTSARIGTFERGTKSPSLPELEVLAFFLDIPMEHFWGQVSLSNDDEERVETSKMNRLIPLRQRIIGTLLRKTRLEAEMSPKEIAEATGISSRRLKSYELGERPISLPELEVISGVLNLPIAHFCDQSGPVGQWNSQQQAIQRFLTLPPDLQEFVSMPVNIPYLELSQRLSSMSVEKLRSVAEGLLDITL